MLGRTATASIWGFMVLRNLFIFPFTVSVSDAVMYGLLEVLAMA